MRSERVTVEKVTVAEVAGEEANPHMLSLVRWSPNGRTTSARRSDQVGRVATTLVTTGPHHRRQPREVIALLALDHISGVDVV